MQATPARPRAVAVAAIVVVAAACFWPAMTTTLERVDQGQLVYPAWRVARGDLPYRDFHHFYWPSAFYVNGVLLRWFGENLLVVRLGLLAVKVAIVAFVFVAARAVARASIAAFVSVWLVALWSSTVWINVVPYGSYYTLAASMAGLAILVAAPGASPRRALVAGLCFGIGATFKQTLGLLGAVGAGVALVSAPSPPGARDAVAGPARLLRVVVMVAAALVVAVYPARPLGPWTIAVLVGPPLLALGLLAIRDREAHTVAAGRASPTRVLAFCLGCVMPVAAWTAFFASAGLLGPLVNDTLTGLPQSVRWFVPLARPSWLTIALAAVLVVGLVALHAGWTRLLALAVLGNATLMAYYVLPAWGGVAVEIQRLLPVVLVWASAPLVFGSRASQPSRLLWWYGAFCVVSLSPSSDVLHAILLLPAVIPLLALLIEQVWASSAGHRLGRVLVAALGGGPLLLPVAQSALMFATTHAQLESRGAPEFARASLIRDPGGDARDMHELIERIDRTVSRGVPLLVLPSAQLFYFLADRSSALPEMEMVLYLVSLDVLRPADARAFVSQDEVVARLRAARPVIVRTRGAEWDHVVAAFPALAGWIDAHYTVADVVGPTEILEPRG